VGDPRTVRQALFAFAVVAIVGMAFFSMATKDSPVSSPKAVVRDSDRPVVSSRMPTAVSQARLRQEISRSAHRFLEAFFRYEVGDLDEGVWHALSATSTARFFRDLLGRRPRPTGSVFPPPARLKRLDVAFLPASPPRAIVSGFAVRAHAPEEFSFLFELVDSTWLASGPGA
jgi:hypothetical protein